ncbi:MAG: hypothetical protein K5657_03000 [Desulfovibrio sp.]|nr:hypothetical protein [Desulfovibrio sp.]
MNTTSLNHVESMVNLCKPCENDLLEVSNENGTEELLIGRVFPPMQALSAEGGQLIESLEKQLDTLQEAFIALLSKEMKRVGVHLENRLHLSLSEEGDVVVEGEDNDTDKVQEILSHSSELQSRFRELAHLTLLSQGIDMVCQAKAALEGNARCFSPIFSHYHAYIKGSLSHFYLKSP